LFVAINAAWIGGYFAFEILT